MKRLFPIIALSPLFFGGAALAQSFEAPSIPGFSGMPGFEVPQIDPPSLDISTGPSDAGDSDGDTISDLAEVQEAIDTVSNNAWEGQPAGGSASTNPDFLNPDILNAVAEAQEAIASGISEALVTTAAGIVESLNPLFLNPLFLNPDIFNETDPGVALLELLAAVKEVVRSRLQQGRVILDSDFGP